jgi:acetoin utilization deacetylase AcuC-like enzyme
MEAPGRRAVALIRPPGHHATARRGEGYCIFNNAGLAALAALDAGAERVVIIDWDAHHGNGAQSFFYEDPRVLAISIHMHTGQIRLDRTGGDGLPSEIGAGFGTGTTLNVDLPYGVGDDGYARTFRQIIQPAVAAFAPSALICAMGQDAAMCEANGRQCLTMRGFHNIGASVSACADDCSNAGVTLIEEGGYSLSYAPLCLYATLAGVIGRDLAIDDPLNYLPLEEPPGFDDAIAASTAALAALRCAVHGRPRSE